MKIHLFDSELKVMELLWQEGELAAKDIAAALTAVQKDNGYMFDTAPTPPPLAAGTGSTTMIGGKDADTAMRKAMGLPTK